MNSRNIQIVLLAALTLTIAACDPSESVGKEATEPGYLTEEIPPCTPAEGSPVDPCEPGVELPVIAAGGAASLPNLGVEPASLRRMLDFDGALTFVSHLVLRGTYLPGTVRCTTGNPFRPPSYLSYEEYDYVDHSFTLKCYADVRVNAYVLGTGPSNLTVQTFFYTYWEGDFVQMAADEGTTERELIEDTRQRFETYVGGVAGREVILFIGPPSNISAEVWQLKGAWDVQRREDSTVIAVHPNRDLWQRLRSEEYQTHRSALEMELPAFTQAVTTAHEARVAEYGGRIGADTSLPMLETDANRLRQAVTAIGAYNHPDGTPSQPPPAPVCASGIAVPDAGTNRGLLHDCEMLLAAKDMLRGTGSLNWATATAIGSWDGVTTSGTPSRVTKLELDSESLTGSIPAEIGRLFKLTHLDLSNNSLSGDIPAELGWLSNLEEIRLSGNSLTGCIPVTLKDVTTNDLSSLNLLYCTPPAPGAPTAGMVGETTVPLSWTAISNTSKYRVEWANYSSTDWTVDDDSITGTSHTVDELLCETEHFFRVSAYGSGTTYAAMWSDPSEALIASTGDCTAK